MGSNTGNILINFSKCEQFLCDILKCHMINRSETKINSYHECLIFDYESTFQSEIRCSYVHLSPALMLLNYVWFQYKNLHVCIYVCMYPCMFFLVFRFIEKCIFSPMGNIDLSSKCGGIHKGTSSS